MTNSNTQTSSIDLSLYVRTPVVSIASGISLAEALIAGCPTTAPLSVLKAQKKLAHTLQEARNALAVRHHEERQLSEQDRRFFDQEADNSWAGLRYRLLGYTLLPKDKFAHAQRAEELLTILFGTEGLAFLTESYAVQSVMMATLLQRIKQEKLDKELDTLCGPEFMKHLNEIVPRYEKMVEQNLLHDSSSKINLREHVRALTTAILNYTTKVVATIEDDDPSTLALAQKMLRPIDAYREQTAFRKTKTSDTQSSLTPSATVDSEV